MTKKAMAERRKITTSLKLELLYKNVIQKNTSRTIFSSFYKETGVVNALRK